MSGRPLLVATANSGQVISISPEAPHEKLLASNNAREKHILHETLPSIPIDDLLTYEQDSPKHVYNIKSKSAGRKIDFTSLESIATVIQINPDY
jgi:hypothetical protein